MNQRLTDEQSRDRLKQNTTMELLNAMHGVSVRAIDLALHPIENRANREAEAERIRKQSERIKEELITRWKLVK